MPFPNPTVPPSPPRQHTFGESLSSNNTILNRVYDALTDTISINLASGSINLTASLGSVKIEDALNATQKLAVLPDGSINVNVVLSGLTDSIALTDHAGTLIDPATETTLLSIRDTLGIYQIQQPVTIGNFPASQSVFGSLAIAFPSASVASVPAGNVAAGLASTLALAANPGRLAATFVNDSDTTIYLALGNPAVLNGGIPLSAAGGSFEINLMNRYVGAVYCITSAANRNLAITEF